MPSKPQAETREPDLKQKVAFLCDPASYSERTSRVESRETHMAWVFLTDNHAYKLKKPLATELLDFSTIAARRHYCMEEVRLNRRLSSSYLGITPLTQLDGQLQLGGSGAAVDWLVQMRRLPAEREFKHLLLQHAIGDEEINLVARRLARFYLAQVPAPTKPNDYLSGLLATIRGAETVLRRPGSPVPAAAVQTLAEQLGRFLQRSEQSYTVRVRNGRIIEGHGDLRPEHIYLTGEPEVIDCLEFSRRLRVLDIADELAFLGMECERLGAPWLTESLFQAYARFTDDRPPRALCHFYMSFRALIWAQLAVGHPGAGGGEAAHWAERAQQYLALAERHLEAAQRTPLDATF